MAFHPGIQVDVFASGAWQNATADAQTAEKIVVQRGYTEEGAIQASTLALTLDDPTDRWRPTNPTALTYDGKGGRNSLVSAFVDAAPTSYIAECSRWMPDQTPDFSAGPPLLGRRWVAVEAAGILRRVSQWRDPIRSAMYRHRTGYPNLLGYWPLEDPSTAVRLSNAAPGGRAGTLSNVTLQGIKGPAGSDSVVQLAQESSLAGRFNSPAAGVAGWQVSFSFILAALPPGAGDNQIIRWTTSNRYQWIVWVNNAVYRFQVFDEAGTSILNVPVLWGSGAEPNKWITMRVRATPSGGNVTVEAAWYPQQANVLYVMAPTVYAGTPGALVDWQQPGNSYVANGGIAHVYAVSGTTDDLLGYGPLRSFDGYEGETAGARFLRLMTEAGVPRELRGVESKTSPMGVQRPDTIIGLLEEIERTEGGLIFDKKDAAQVVFRTRDSRYNTTPTMALTYPTHIAPPLSEIIDDQQTANNVTIRQRDGGEATARRTTGPMSVANVGDYPKAIDVNVSAATDLGIIAEWEMARGTVPGPRYSAVVIDLDMNPGLEPQINATDIGDRITITGREPELVDLYVIGYTDTFETHRRTISYLCRRNDVFVVGIYDDPGSRYDSASTTLAAGATAGAGTFALTTADRRDVWSTTAVPYQCIVAGEAVTVTAMTAPAGTGPYTQTATVTRAVNGIVKAQNAGAQFQLRNPVRYAR